MNTFPSYPVYPPRGDFPEDVYEHEEKINTEEFPNRIYEEPYNEPSPVPQSSAVSENGQNGKESNQNIKNQYPKNNIENNSNSNSDKSSNRVVAVNSAVAPENLNIFTNTDTSNSNIPTNNNKNINTNPKTNSNSNNNKTNNISKNNATTTIEYSISNATADNSNNNISNATSDNSNNNNNISTGLDDEYYSNNLLNVQEIDPNEFQPKHLTKTTLRAATATVTRTYTRTYTRTAIPTYINNNNNNNNNVNRNTNTNYNTNRTSNNNYSSNRNNNVSSQGSQNINRNSSQSIQSNKQNTKTIPSQVIGNRDPIGTAYNTESNEAQSVNTPGYITGIDNNGEVDLPQNASNLDAAIVPDGAETGFHSTSNTIDQDINQIQTGSDNGEKSGSKFSFVIILISIPIIIIVCIASIFFLKKRKNGNTVYPDDEIKRDNLFGTIQLYKPNKFKHNSESSGSRGSRTNLTNLSRGSRTNLTNLSNDRESNVPEYSEWLEAGSNTMSMPPVSPPPLVTEDKINGLNGSNFAMGGNIGNQSNNGTLRINKPQAARMAWKLEGMRVGRDSTHRSERQSLFSSFQVW